MSSASDCQEPQLEGPETFLFPSGFEDTNAGYNSDSGRKLFRIRVTWEDFFKAVKEVEPIIAESRLLFKLAASPIE